MEHLRQAAELWLERARPKLEAMSSPEVPPGYMAGFISRNEGLVLDLMVQRLGRDSERLAKLQALLANIDELAWQLIDSIAEQVLREKR